MYQQNQIFDNTYQILNEIGKGGTGTVFLAWHLRLQKYVVLKEVRAKTLDEMARLRIEVDTLKSLHHPHLPQVYDFIETETSVFTVMDFIEGVDLQSYLKQGIRCPVDDLIRWFKQITEVLVYLGSQNPPVIHSDIKPANIIITPQNDAVLIDFNVSLSKKTDTIVGLSMNYASPEQLNMMQHQAMNLAANEFMDTRSDIYSLCASFYHLISWRLPSVYYGTIPLSQIENEYPEAFCDIVDKGMQIEKEDRFSSAEEMKKALDQMWKRNNGYKAYLILQVAVIVLSAVFLAFGATRLISGIKTKNMEEFSRAYDECVKSINMEEADEVILKGPEFLRIYDKQLEQDPEKKANILLGLARSYFAQDNFIEAGKYFADAARIYAEEQNTDLLLECLTGRLTVALKTGDEEAARDTLEEAEASALDSNALLLLKIQREEGAGQNEECLRMVKELEENSEKPEQLAEAFLSAANCEEQEWSELNWLKKAVGEAEKVKDEINRVYLLRKAGTRLLKFGIRAMDSNAREAYDEAITCYQIIEKTEWAVKTDTENLETAKKNRETLN